MDPSVKGGGRGVRLRTRLQSVFLCGSLISATRRLQRAKTTPAKADDIPPLSWREFACKTLMDVNTGVENGR